MIERDQKLENAQTEFIGKYTLSVKQFETLLAAKIQRAEQYFRSDKHRELLRKELYLDQC